MTTPPKSPGRTRAGRVTCQCGHAGPPASLSSAVEAGQGRAVSWLVQAGGRA